MCRPAHRPATSPAKLCAPNVHLEAWVCAHAAPLPAALAGASACAVHVQAMCCPCAGACHTRIPMTAARCRALPRASGVAGRTGIRSPQRPRHRERPPVAGPIRRPSVGRHFRPHPILYSDLVRSQEKKGIFCKQLMPRPARPLCGMGSARGVHGRPPAGRAGQPFPSVGQFTVRVI